MQCSHNVPFKCANNSLTKVQHMKTDAETVHLTYPYSRNDCYEERKKRQKPGTIVEVSGKEESTLTTQSRSYQGEGALLEQDCYPERLSQRGDALRREKQKDRVKGQLFC